MNITPKRALELAYTQDELANNSFIVCDVSKQKYHEEVAAALRHYAEIAPKWQAVLDAEPVMWTRLSGTGKPMFGMLKPAPKMDGSELDGLTGLIIKPAP